MLRKAWARNEVIDAIPMMSTTLGLFQGDSAYLCSAHDGVVHVEEREVVHPEARLVQYREVGEVAKPAQPIPIHEGGR